MCVKSVADFAVQAASKSRKGVVLVTEMKLRDRTH